MRKVYIVRGRREASFTNYFIDSIFTSKKRAQKWCEYKNQGATEPDYFVTTFDLL